MSEINYIEIGSRIRDARIQQKLTQEEASERCDITSSYYGNIERGDKKMSLETLMKISKGLGISTDKILFGEIPDKELWMELLLKEIQHDADETQFEKYLTIIKTISTIIDQL